MRKKLPFLLVILSLIFIAVCCTNEQVENENSLEDYLNKDSQIIEEMKKQPIGATGPSLVYAHKQYAVILNFNGILIYDFDKENIIHTIDNMSLELNKMQGSDYTVVKSNDEEIALGNVSTIENTAYVYNIPKNKLRTTNAEGIKDFKEAEQMNNQELLNRILDGNAGNAVYNEAGNIVLLTYRYEDGTDSWVVSILEKDTLEQIQQANVFN